MKTPRLKRIEGEFQFRLWVSAERMLESMNMEELRSLAATGQWPDRPDPAPGTSRLDTMDRKELIKMWKDDQKEFGGRNSADLAYYATHGHWQEQGCGKGCLAESRAARL